ncbi:rolling circle replication-associated protein [Thalassotalea profundi]|uniref:Replication-associated protein ORF2/G2P domain-containing protein n=1 Tax=Thalassotalea profundi TaxID=2036687 RepID=A0ABQ3INS4_9GAMM|nr:hypothetical protein [Thalassotalea profundi]GHE87409.1 hypothetical protein GCM10011501_16080 [Thalassotalea profundi]
MVINKAIDHSKRLIKPLFLVPTKKQLQTVDELNKEFDLQTKKHRVAAQNRVAIDEERLRLVKRGESPTKEFQHVASAKKHVFDVQTQVNQYEVKKWREHCEKLHFCPEPLSLPSRKTISEREYVKSQNIKPLGSISANSKVCVRLYAQEWANKFRFGFESGALGAKVAPPITTGERKTNELTKNATRQILESGAYLSATRAGYTTFLTLTFDDIARGKLKREETTIGKEVSRFFDAAQKIYQRGMEVGFYQDDNGEFIDYDKPKKIKFSLPMYCPELVFPRLPCGDIKALPDLEECIPYNFRKHIECDYLENDAVYGLKKVYPPLDYMWVAENPKNKAGEDNPHVHIMMRWKVEKKHFRAWAERLESIWGHGFAKLERIHTPQAASNYLLKAVGYLSKGSSGEQGEIKGNRYNVSASARAPKWECIGEFFADNFIAILGELREKLHRKKLKAYADKIAVNAKLSEEKAKFKKLSNINKKSPSEKRQAYIEHLKNRLLGGDKALKSINEKLSELPFINDFAIGNLNKEQADNFIYWAMRERFWNTAITDDKATFNQLKKQTFESIKFMRQAAKIPEHIILTNKLTWQWAENDSNFEAIETRQDIFIDDNGVEWSLDKNIYKTA